VQVPGLDGEIAERIELYRERLPLGPCAGFSNLLKMFSVVNKGEHKGGVYALKQTLVAYPARLRYLLFAPTLSNFDSIERG